MYSRLSLWALLSVSYISLSGKNSGRLPWEELTEREKHHRKVMVYRCKLQMEHL